MVPCVRGVARRARGGAGGGAGQGALAPCPALPPAPPRARRAAPPAQNLEGSRGRLSLAGVPGQRPLALRAIRLPPMTQAAEALAAGQVALAAGDAAGAVRWLDRARRLAPGDPVVAMVLGAACLAGDPARAAALFASVPASVRPREGAWGVVAARLALGDAAGAAEALASVLARFVVPEGLAGLASAVAQAVGAAGWCGVGAGGAVVGTADPLAPGTVLGSPLRVDLVRRMEGCVAAEAGGLRGWAWMPGDPEAAPELILRVPGRPDLRLVCTDPAPEGVSAGPLVRPRGFSVPASALAGGARRGLRVLGLEGADLLGSPLDLDPPAAVRVGRAGPPRRVPRGRAPAVVVPVHGQRDAVAACLRAVLATVPAGTPVVVVDDAGPEPELRRDLRALAVAGRIRLIRHRRALGFPAAANAGVAACPGRDVVLLNSDTVPSPGWLARLRAVADTAPDIGTVTPLSNNAGIVSYPGPAGTNPMPGPAGGAWLAEVAWRAHGARTVGIPVGVGFCLYVRRACWAQAGPFRASLFAQGYGEETDFCLRARALGWRHVAAPGVYVAHRGGLSFGTAAAAALQARNQAVLERAHPGYAAEVAAFLNADPLAPARRRLDLARWQAARRSGALTAAVPVGDVPGRRAAPAPAVLLITHADGGGVERVVAESCRAHRAAGRRPIVLRPGAGAGRGQDAVLDTAPGGDTQNLRFALPREAPALRRLLRAETLAGIELHHLLGHHPAVAELVDALGVPYEAHVHDYAWVCPRVTLTRPGGAAGADDRYCGEPAASGCRSCLAAHGSLLDEPIGLRALRARSAALLGGARRVVVPSADAAARLRRYFPRLRPEVVPPEDDAALPAPAAAPRAAEGRVLVCVVGAIGPAKGVGVLAACARDAARRNLPLGFVVVGSTTEDAALLATGRVFVTGPFRAEEAEALIRAQRAQLALLPSVWPETWCFALTDAWRAGLDVVAFDLGAPAERMRRTGRGLLLPPGLPAGRINDMLLARAVLPVHA